MKPAAFLIVFVAAAYAQPPLSSGAVVYENGRFLTGDGRAPIENGALVVEDGRILALGRKGEVRSPSGALRVDLSGKTVMPAMVNVHVHIGYEGYTSWGAENYTPENVLDHLEREAFYGVGATQTVGSSPTDESIQFARDQQAGKFPQASRFFFVPGMAPPNGGPDAILRKGTSALHAVYEVSTGVEARAAVQSMAAKGLKNVKIWVDDRRGTYPKMTPEAYDAVIDEAHKHGMLVHAHAIALADQKAVVRAGADVLVHIVASEKIDDELQALVRERKAVLDACAGGWETGARFATRIRFVDQALPGEAIAAIRRESCGTPGAGAAMREEMLAYNFPRMIAAGARIVLGTDAGIVNRYSFGWADHHESSRYVQLGLTPAEAIVAATRRAAELMGIQDMGALETGKSADFVVLNANPLDAITNTRQIAMVVLRGKPIDRASLLAKWKRAR